MRHHFVHRRAAMMATLRCDHPDIGEFIAAKRTPGALRHFNLSVLVSDEFMDALREDAEWPLVFPLAEGETPGGETLLRSWSGSATPRLCRVVRRVAARALWEQLMRVAYDCAEPGVIFIDRVNRLNNLGRRETISATNPCGEIPLPPYGACNLGALYQSAYDQGLKGCTVFRPNPVTGQVLLPGAADGGAQCCALEREAD